jgi:hypothetical protein
MGFRKSKDASCRGIDGTRELGTQPGGSALVPLPRLKDVEASLGTEAEAHGGGSALEEFPAENVPRDGRGRVGTMGLEAAVELGSLSIGELKHLFRVSHAVPEVLSQLNSLGHGQAAEVRASLGHVESSADRPGPARSSEGRVELERRRRIGRASAEEVARAIEGLNEIVGG